MAAKPGYQTTEFILTVVVNVAAVVGTLGGLIPASWSLLIMAGINAVYGILRAIIKNGDPSYNAPALPNTTTITASSSTT